MKCEHHEDHVKLIETKNHEIERRITTLETDMVDVKRVTTEHKLAVNETQLYIKELYGKFDSLTSQMKVVVDKMDQYITSLAVAQEQIRSSNSFQKRGKDLVFEIIKWLLVLGLGALIGTK